MSTQTEQQQPVVTYPNTPVIGQSQPLPTQSHGGGGSFGTVIAVLAVIIVVSAVACCLGRFCNKKQNKEKAPKPSKHKQSKQQKHQKPVSAKEPDIEFGFDKGFQSTKSSRNGDHKGHKKGGDIHMKINGHFKGDNNIYPLDREPKFGPM